MNDYPDGIMCEPECNAPMTRGKDQTISFDRRKELVHLAEEAANWIVAHNVKQHELCMFKSAVGMIVDSRN